MVLQYVRWALTDESTQLKIKEVMMPCISKTFISFLLGKWVHWNTCVEEYVYPSSSTPEYGSILVPNVDNVRMDFLIKTIEKQGKVLLYFTSK